MFQLDKIVYLRSALESKDSQINNQYFNWYAEAHQTRQNSKIASLKTLLKN